MKIICQRKQRASELNKTANSSFKREIYSEIFTQNRTCIFVHLYKNAHIVRFFNKFY